MRHAHYVYPSLSTRSRNFMSSSSTSSHLLTFLKSLKIAEWCPPSFWNKKLGKHTELAEDTTFQNEFEILLQKNNALEDIGQGHFLAVGNLYFLLLILYREVSKSVQRLVSASLQHIPIKNYKWRNQSQYWIWFIKRLPIFRDHKTVNWWYIHCKN